METRPHALLVGISVILLTLGSVLFTAWIGQGDWFREKRTYLIYFDNAVTGLLQGGLVDYQGVPVGKVEAITLDASRANRVRVKISIDKSLLIQEGTTATLQLQGLTGNRFIRLKSGEFSSKPLIAKKGEKYPRIPSVSSSLDDLVESLPKTLKNVADAAKNLSGLATPKNQERIEEILESLRVASKSLPTLTTNFEKTLKDFSKTLKTWEKAGTEVTQAAKPLQQWIQHLDFFVKEGTIKLDTLLKDSETLVKKWNHLTDAFQQNPLGFFEGKLHPTYPLEEE